MTVKELIEHLQTLPQDATVVYACCSEYNRMDKDQVQEFKPDGHVVGLIERDGGYVMRVEDYWLKQQGENKVLEGGWRWLTNVVEFPGN